MAVELSSLQPFPHTLIPSFSLSLPLSTKHSLNYRHSDWRKRCRVRAGCAAACKMSSLWLITRFEWHSWASPYCPGQASLIGSGEAGLGPQLGNCIASVSATATFAIGCTLPRGCPQPLTHSPRPRSNSHTQMHLDGAHTRPSRVSRWRYNPRQRHCKDREAPTGGREFLCRPHARRCLVFSFGPIFDLRQMP